MKRIFSILLAIVITAEIGTFTYAAYSEDVIYYEQNYNLWETGNVSSGAKNMDDSKIYYGGTQQITEFPDTENKSYSFVKASGSVGAVVQYTIPKLTPQNIAVAEFDLYLTEHTGSLYIDVRGGNFKCSCIVIGKDGSISFSDYDTNVITSEMVVRENRWYNIRLVMDMNEEKTSLCVDNDVLFDNCRFNSSYFHESAPNPYYIDRLVFTVSGADEGREAAYNIDNMKIYSFSGADEDEETAGNVICTSPCDGELRVDPNKKVAILFDKAVNRDTLNSDTIKAVSEEGTYVNCEMRYDVLGNKCLLCYPWEENTSYTVIVDGVEDLYGNEFGGIDSFSFSTGERVQHTEIFVEQGNRGGDGTFESPFGTFEEARNHIRRLKTRGIYPQKGVTVSFRQGVYPVAETMTLSEDDSGTEEGPVIYQAYQNEKVEFTGGIYFDPANYPLVTDETALKRLDSSVLESVRQISLSELGLTADDFGEIDLRGSGSEFLFTMGYTNRTPYADLYFGNERMSPARWPNLVDDNSYTTVNEVIDGGTDSTVVTMEDVVGMSFTADIPADKLVKWQGLDDAWLHGLWYYDWSDSSARIKSIDAQTGTITTEHPSASQVRSGQRFYAYNIFDELDFPGEWYLDKESGNLYVYPSGEGDVLISVFTGSLLYGYGLSDVIIKGIDFKGTRTSAVELINCTRVGMEDAQVSCTADYGVSISNSLQSYIKDSEICTTGGPAAGVSGGDFTTLTPGESYIDNCHIHDFGERNLSNNPGVHISGVGNTISHCEIHDGPHQAIRFNGNDNIMEYNNIYKVCKLVDDAAAIYTFLGVVKRGNIIRHNYIHDLVSTTTATAPLGIYGVYNDGGMCGNTIVSNVFENISGSGGAVMLGHRNHTVANNIIIDCYSVTRVTGGGLYDIDAEYDAAKAGLTSDFYKNPPYTKYDNLADILEDEPNVNKYNTVRNNIQYSKTKFIGYSKDMVFSHLPGNSTMEEQGVTIDTLHPDINDEERAEIEELLASDGNYLAKEYIRQRNTFEDSYMTRTDPGFADDTEGNYCLLGTSDVYTRFEDFEAPDFANIGLRSRASFRIEGISVNDTNGNPVLRVSPDTGKVDINAKLVNNSPDLRDVVLLAGLYDENDNLITSDLKEAKLPFGTSEVSLLDFDITGTGKLKLKVFVWKGMDSLAPFEKPYRY